MIGSSPFVLAEIFPDYRGRVEFWAAMGCVFLFVLIAELVRRQRLKERYSFLWFLTVGVMTVFTVRRDWLGALSEVLGIYYPPTALFLLLVGFMLLILIHYSLVISRLLKEKQVLVQRLGAVEARLNEVEKKQNAQVRSEDEEPSRQVS